jgi:hypothetical protein
MDWQKLSESLMGLWPIVIALLLAATNWYIQGWILTNPKPKDKEKEGKRLQKRAMILLIVAAITGILIMLVYEISIWVPLMTKTQ